MPREFKVVGKIDENTRVLGVAYAQVQQAIEAGFQEQFRLQQASEAKISAHAGPLALAIAENRRKARRGLRLPLTAIVKSGAYNTATTRGFAERALDDHVNSVKKLDVTVSGGRLLMRTSDDDAPAPAYRRRAGEKDFSR